MKKINHANESGMALVITMGILLLVTLMAVGFFSSQYTARDASVNYRYGVVAEELADGALSSAILLLREDMDNKDPLNPDYQLFDSLNELWGPWYQGGNEKRFAYQGSGKDKGIDLDKITKGNIGADDMDARWIDVKDDKNFPIGRIAVLIVPENSKININSAGAYQFASPPLVAQGYSTHEINLFELFTALGLDEPLNSERVENWRYSGEPDPAVTAGKAGDDGNDDDENDGYLYVDKIDNNGDGVIDEANEGVNDPYEYLHNVAVLDIPALSGNDFRYQSARMALIAWVAAADVSKAEYYEKSLGSFLTAHTYENDLIDFNGAERVRLNHFAFPYQLAGSNNGDMGKKTPLAELIRDTFINAGMNADEAAQLAVNIVDYADYDFNNGTIRADVRTQLERTGDAGKPFLGIEKTVYINEVNGASYDSADPLLDKDADNDYIELINISERPIDLNGWSIEAGGKSFTFGATTIGAYAGWGNTANIIVVAVEKGPDPVLIDPGTGLPMAPVPANGYYTGNGHSFLDDVVPGGDDARIIAANSLGDGLDGSDRITLKDNNGNIVDVVDSSDSADPQAGAQKTWQKNDPTMEVGAQELDQTALSNNSNLDPTPAGNAWLDLIDPDDLTSPKEAKHVKDRYFSSVAEIACVSSPIDNWTSFVDKGSVYPGLYNYYDLLFKVFDKFTIAIGFPPADLTNQFTVPSSGFSIGPPVTSIMPGFTGEQALVYGRININTIIENEQKCIYDSIRIDGGKLGDAYGPIQGYLRAGNGFGEPDGTGYFGGLGGIGAPGSQIKIEQLMSISNLLTTKSNVFKIIIVAQAYDRQFKVASERKLEVIVDRGYNIDPSAPGYSQEAKDKAKQVKILSYRWITEEE